MKKTDKYIDWYSKCGWCAGTGYEGVVCVDAGFYCTIAHKGEPGRLY